MKYFFLIASVLFTFGCSEGCAKAPPNLTPEASVAFKGTQAVKALDALRDVAIAANAQTPPLLDEATTRRVVLYHQATVKVIQSSPEGWRAAAQTGLDELSGALGQKERALLAPYIALAKAVFAASVSAEVVR